MLEKEKAKQPKNSVTFAANNRKCECRIIYKLILCMEFRLNRRFASQFTNMHTLYCYTIFCCLSMLNKHKTTISLLYPLDTIQRQVNDSFRGINGPNEKKRTKWILKSNKMNSFEKNVAQIDFVSAREGFFQVIFAGHTLNFAGSWVYNISLGYKLWLFLGLSRFREHSKPFERRNVYFMGVSVLRLHIYILCKRIFSDL